MSYLWVLLIASCVSYSSSLVHYVKLEKGADGCKTEDGKELKVGHFVQDDNVCGVKRCISKKGEALILYCQRPLPFALCKSKNVSTKRDFPWCCWACVVDVECDAEGKPIGEKPEEKKKD